MRVAIVLWNFAVGYFCTASVFVFHPLSSFERSGILQQISGTIFEIIGGVATAVILTIFKKWGIAKYNSHKQSRKNKYDSNK
jgi:hypothetical protein